MKVRRWAEGLALTSLVLTQAQSAWAADPAPDPTPACIQASDQGQSQRDAGKYRAARASFLQCARDECPAVVLKSCAGWLRELDDLAPTLVLDARDEQGGDLAEVTVTFDGATIASRLDGRPIEVDPGEHVIRFERVGSVALEQRIILRAGEKARVLKVTLRAEAPVTPELPEVVPVPPPPEALTSPRHVAAAGLWVGAAAAAGTGLYFVLRANHDQQSAAGMRSGLSTSACNGVTTASCQSLADTVHAQHTDAGAAAGLFVGAGVLAAGSIVAWMFLPRTRAGTTGSIAPLPGGALLSVSGDLPSF
jgi:hypothetical protein